MNNITATITIAFIAIFFIGGAFLLCAYKEWSLWTIVVALLITSSIIDEVKEVNGLTHKSSDARK